MLDAEGDPDTSFLVKIPADTPFTFQTIDRNGLVLNMAQTWQQVRPGEVRTDCGGCHAHSQMPLRFEGTVASASSYQVYDLSRVTPLVSHDSAGRPTLRVESRSVVDVEFYRDIRPILQRRAVSWAAASLLRGQLFEIEPRDPVSLGGAVAVLVAAALLATYLPARRAASVDATTLLRAF